jgi:hypothetical protein
MYYVNFAIKHADLSFTRWSVGGLNLLPSRKKLAEQGTGPFFAWKVYSQPILRVEVLQPAPIRYLCR